MKFHVTILHAVLVLIMTACAGSRVPGTMDPSLAEWPEISLDDYPGLVTDSSEVTGNFSEYELDVTHFLEMRPRLDEYKQGYGCQVQGLTTLQFVVTPDARIEAPRVVASLAESCDTALLLFLKDLRIEEPARVNGRPVPYLATLQMRI